MNRRPQALGALLLASGLAAAFGALRTPAVASARPHDDGTQRGTDLAVPVWSPRRAPDALADAIGAHKLGESIARTLAGTRACVEARSEGAPILAIGTDRSLAPASNQKLLVGLATLALIGPDFRFETQLLARERPRQGSIGDLWLVGAGDPFLATPEFAGYLEGQPLTRGRPATRLDTLADELVKAGVSTVSGGVHADDSRHSRERALPSWKTDYLADHEVGPLGALVVDDGWSAWAPGRVPAADPALHAASQLVRLAAGKGVVFPASALDGPRRGSPPAEHVVLATVRSAPLSELVAAMLRESSNLAAELFVRELGARSGGGTTEAGLAEVRRALLDLHIPLRGVEMVDGSGLDVANRATCPALLGALLEAGPPGPQGAFSGLIDGLAVAGRSGTLATRMKGAPLAGRLEAKTGSLDGVVALTGFVDGQREVAFAFVANGRFSTEEGRRLQEQVSTALARFPEGPEADLLRPPASRAVAG